MAEFVPGQRVAGVRGAYTIDRKLGEGGFGVAFLAADDAGRRLVLKQLQLARMGEWKAMELFEREARALASLSHPNIPRCHEFFAGDGARAVPAADLARLGEGAALVLVQDYVDGASLQARIDAGERLTSARVEAILRELLGVLDYLHGLHPPVVHRDIKPANIVLTAGGTPMLVDFGAVQDRVHLASEHGSTTVGTFGYFPLEQVLGKARPASDLYALAMTMMVALTHRAPEELPLDPATSKVLVREAAPALPDAIARALEGMLEPAIGQRTQTAADALRHLDGTALQPARAALPVPKVHSIHPLEWKVPLWGGGLGAAAIYTVAFDSFSETELVQLSFVWVPIVAYGLGVRSTGLRRAGLAWALFSLCGLVAFFEGIFPAL